MEHKPGQYYLPSPSYWPIVGSIALFTLMYAAASWLHGAVWAPYLFGTGFFILLIMVFGWFRNVIHENEQGLYLNPQVDRSFRWGMTWFIFSEVMFFGAFFGALFYARLFAIPWLAGHGVGEMTHYLLWPNFEAHWPLLKTPDPSQFVGPHSVMYTWGIPAFNTAVLLTSGGTITWAHWALIKQKRTQALLAQCLTIALGITFLFMQFHEYGEAYLQNGLRLDTGIYGNTFFMLTGFHGLHVTLGTIMLIVIGVRMAKGHFKPKHHFAFEAVSWYWHFVDVVWLFLFVFVYWL